MIYTSAILFGSFAGLVAGLIPGVGNFVILLLMYPFLSAFNITELLIFYLALACISQYVSSIPAIFYGVPGESSSMPTVTESRRLENSTHAGQALSGSAFATLIGSFYILAAIWFFADQAELVKYFYSTVLLAACLIIVTLVLCFTVNNSYITNLMLVTAGLVLGLIGYNPVLGFEFASFNNSYLYGGLPLEVVMVCLFAIPEIIKTMTSTKLVDRAVEYTKFYFVNPLASLFYTAIGFVAGLVPGLTTIMSAMAAYNISSLLTKNPVKRIVAAETANNSGAVSQILPLVLFGIPILASEALLLHLLESQGFRLHNLDTSTLLISLAFNLVFVNIIGFMLSWPLSRYSTWFFKIDFQRILAVLLVLLVSVVLYSGYISYSIWYYMILLVIFLPLGYWLSKFNTLPLLFAFLIHDKLFESLLRITQLF